MRTNPARSLTEHEAARLLGVSWSTLKRRALERRIRHYVEGGRRMYLPEWIDDYRASLTRDVVVVEIGSHRRIKA